MSQSRREFFKAGLGTVTVFGMSLLKVPGMEALARAAEPETIAEIPVVWIATGGCSGCSVALLNAASPTIQDLLLDQVLPGKHLSLGFHTTVMAASGDLAIQALHDVVSQHKGQYILVVDGAAATKDEGLYCSVGEVDGRPLTGYDQVRDLGRSALAVLAVGACAAFGGIPAAGTNPTGCVCVSELFQREGIKTPLVNIPGCPPHPDWIVGTIATILLGGLAALRLDKIHRPAAYFSQCVHDNCSYRGHLERGQFAEHFGEHGCLLKLGCKGPITYADCPVRKFNNGTNWCCEAGHPCIGCCHPDFPFAGSLFRPVEPAQLDFPSIYAEANPPNRPNTDTYVAVGLLGAGGFLAGVGATAAAMKMRSAKSDIAESVSADASGVQEQNDGENEPT